MVVFFTKSCGQALDPSLPQWYVPPKNTTCLTSPLIIIIMISLKGREVTLSSSYQSTLFFIFILAMIKPKYLELELLVGIRPTGDAGALGVFAQEVVEEALELLQDVGEGAHHDARLLGAACGVDRVA